MSTTTEKVVRFQLDAGQFAFEAGQLLEGLLWERASRNARSSEADVVSLELVCSCLNDGFFDDLRKRLDEKSQRESRKAA